VLALALWFRLAARLLVMWVLALVELWLLELAPQFDLVAKPSVMWALALVERWGAGVVIVVMWRQARALAQLFRLVAELWGLALTLLVVRALP